MQESLDDLNRKYAGTWVLLGGNVVFLTEIADYSEEEKTYTFCSATSNVSHGPIDLLQVIMPNTMYFNNASFAEKKSKNPAALRFSRLPKKQWKRSICKDNTWITDFFAGITSHCKLRVHHPACDVESLGTAGISRLVSPTYPEFHRALKLVESFKSIAISPEFAICLSHIHPERFLLRSLYGFVGEADSNMIYVRYPPVEQEVRDYLRRNNVTEVEVEVCPDHKN